MTTPPGYYPAQGDPPGTVRYWDGNQWSDEPMEPPPGYTPTPSFDRDRFGGVGVRIGATVIDGIISLIVMIPVMWSWFRDILDEIDAGATADEIDTTVPGSVIVAILAWTAVNIALIAFAGGTPGKLLTGLRITTEDGVTTPPGLLRAVLRMLPGVVSLLPLVGGLIGLVVTISSLIWVNTDPERRSAYDRIAGTRVVKKSSL